MKHQNKKQIGITIALVTLGLIIGILIPFGDREMHTDNDGHDHSTSSQKETIWTCSMHPQIKLKEPGLCPICAMDLIPLEEGMEADGPFSLTLSEASAKRALIETSPVKKRTLENQLTFYGVVEVNEQTRQKISARFAGRIEKLFVNYTGAKVKRGAPLLSIYSPELITLQQELITNQKNAKSGRDFDMRVFEASKRKLRLLGFSKWELQNILTSKRPMEKLVVRAPREGTVLKLLVTEGGYVKEGTPLVEVADLSSLWLQAEVYERELPFVEIGDTVSFHTELEPSKEITGVVSFIDPLIDMKKRTAQVRITLEQSTLKAGAYGEVKLFKVSEPLLSIPNTAPLYTGKRAVLYVAKRDSGKVTYEGREVVLGKRGRTFTEVISGVAEGEEVVSRGAFRIDGELQIMAKTSVMQVMKSDVEMERSPLPSKLLKVNDSLVALYLSFEEALTADDEQGAKAHFSDLMTFLMKDNRFEGQQYTLWNGELENLKKETHNGTFETILDLRAFLLFFSNTMITLQNEYGFKMDNLFLAHCPMAFDNNGAHWIQQSKELKNPYYGAQMLKCGSIKGPIGE